MKKVISTVLALLAVLFVATSSASAAEPSGICFASQMKSMGQLCVAHAKCWAGAIVNDGVNSCVPGDVEARPLSKIQKAETKNTCLVEGQSAFDDAAALVASGFSSLRDALDPPPDIAGDECASKKIGALGKYCASVLKCVGLSIKNDSVPDACVAAAFEKLDRSFTNTEGRSICATVEDAPTLADAVLGSITVPVIVTYDPFPTTTTTTTTLP